MAEIYDKALPPPAGIDYFTGSVGRHSALMLSAATVSGLAGFFYKIVMTRMLAPEDFAAFYVLLNIFTIFSVPALALETSTSRLTSFFRAAGRQGEIPALFARAARISLCFSLVSAAVFLALGVPAGRFFGMRGPSPVVLTGLAVALFFPLNAGYGAVQGLQRFRWLGGIMIAGSLIRLGAGACLVKAGHGVNGALGASIISITAGIALLFVPLREPAARAGGGGETPAVSAGMAGIFSALLLVTVLAFGDMPAVKRFFLPEEAAVYGAASILGRAVFYIAVPLSIAMFPKVCFARTMGMPTGPILARTVSIFLALAGGLSSIFFFAPGFAARVLFPADYLDAIGLIRVFGPVFIPAGLCLILTQYNLALRRAGFIPMLSAAAAVHLLLLSVFNAGFGQVLAATAASGCAGLILLALWTGRDKQHA